MTAEVTPMFQAFCDECGWESEVDDDEWYVEDLAEKHNEKCHSEEDEEPEETYQELLDRLLQNVRENSR